MLNLLALGHAHGLEHLHQTVGTEQAQQIVLQRQIEAGFTRVALSAGTSAQLVVDTAGLMALGADDLQSAQLLGLVVQLDIRTTAGHVGGDGHGAVKACVRYDLRLQLVELGVQYFMRNTVLAQHIAEQLGSLDGDGADQDGLSLLVRLLHGLHNGFKFLFFGLVNRILHILTDHGTVGGNGDNVHGVDVAELLLLGLGGTCHTRFLLELVEEVLEGDGGQGAALAAHAHVLLGLDGLVQTVGITAARHDTAGELVDDQNLAVLHNVVLVAEHQVVGAQGQDDVVLNLQVLRVGQVLDVEEILHLLHAVLGQVYHLILLIHHEVAGLLNVLAHDGVDLGELLGDGALLQLAGQNVADLVQLGGLAALSGNDQGRSRLVDQYGVNLVDDAVVQLAQNQLLFVNGHVVAQVVESQLVVRHIGDVAGICLSAVIGIHII